ncbi:deoxyguanosinetriphosphate triphosphohydrolase family protein [Vallitalea okinawensis]|uniref:deoxyguanosinetriphosphate triphosphohydrolase family protein n=1 Tax=Vallitalea okinawensis TaxID=2078660 RepID=UPI000CFABEA1|nr:dNTP triphosphohydrolase [Vallitalea okinawensis]
MELSKLEAKEIIMEQCRNLNQLNFRQHEEREERERNPYQRDYARIIYSSSFRRLQGKMQLIGIDTSKSYRNRLTHSLEVSQIARGIADKIKNKTGCQNLYQDDMYVIEACSISHDIGNPPFGHYGERVLDKQCADIGGFEGNAQTIRVLTKLEHKFPKYRGLNLTYRTQLGLIKYFVQKERKRKKFIYEDTYKEYKGILMDHVDVHPRTLDVQIIDIADEIAYAVHDLEDALSLKLFTIDEFMYEFRRYLKQKRADEQCIQTMEKIVLKAKDVANSAANYNSSEEYSMLLRNELTSSLVHRLMSDIGLVRVDSQFKDLTGTANDYELGFNHLELLAYGLKKFTFKCINRTDDVILYERTGEKAIKGLYEIFSDAKYNKNGMLLPVQYRPIQKDDPKELKRCAVDYIAGMMDTYAIDVYKKYYGNKSLDKLYE